VQHIAVASLDAPEAVAATFDQVSRLETLARRVRIETIRMVGRVEGGHPGGALSAADLLVALYFSELSVRPEEPRWPGRDRFVFSKGHACEAYYATMALRGYLAVEELATFGQFGTRLQGHPDLSSLPGVDMSSGSLGMGLSAGFGMALGARLGGGGQRVYVMLGDGECQEGSVWEAMWIAPRYGLGSLTAIVDFNGLQQTPWPPGGVGPREYPWDVDRFVGQWEAAGWHVQDIDGHDMRQILDAFATARAVTDRPSAIVARTVKGKGVSFMEDQAAWHSRVMSAEELSAALEELGAHG
jgi:transketolase